MCEFLAALPAENTKHQIEHKKGAQDDERHEIQPVENIAVNTVGLKEKVEEWKERFSYHFMQIFLLQKEEMTFHISF